MLDKNPKEVKLVFKNFPLPGHRYAREAATAALAAHAQGKFWTFHHKLFENYKTLNNFKIREIAKGVGLDMNRFAKDLKDQAIKTLVIRDVVDGRRMNIRRVPTVFVNGKILGNRTFQVFQEMIAAELKKKQ